METRQEETTRQPKKRSIDFLTPDQLRRKREGNVRAQRALREKRKAEMQALQDQNRDLENRLRAAQTALAQAQEQARGHQSGLDLDLHHVGVDATAPALQLMLGSDMAMPFVPWGENEITTMDVLQIMDDNSDMWTNMPTVTDTANETPGSGEMDADADADASEDSPPAPSIPPSVPFTTIATDQVWSIIPKHSAPVCVLDDALLTLIHQRRPKDNAPEFQKNSFPSVQSLLNSPRAINDPDSPDSVMSPPAHIEDPRFPVSSTIVHNLRHIMTVPGLPEQIAMLQNVSAIVRWLIAPTRANYEAMPLYLRPTATQLVVPHPPWIDVMPWAAVRDWFCSSPSSLATLDNYNLFSAICNETLCLNWPFQDADILLHCTSFASGKPKEAVDEILLNPIFDRHIKDAANWTVGPKIFKVFPELKGKINAK